ncbi:amino acid ABC transporter permease [Rhodovibrionaceae bacterium A322]
MAVDAVGGGRSTGSVWQDQRFRGLVFQALTIGLVGTFFAFIVYNTTVNLERLGVASGFDFLSLPAGYDVSSSLISFTSQDTHGRVFFVGLLNTLLVAGIGIVLATFIGFFVGVLRLSNNWLVSRVAYVYVEVLRNLPLLLQILFWWAIFLALPKAKQALELGGGFFLNNRGLQYPKPLFEDGFFLTPLALLIGIVAAFAVSRWATKRQMETGQHFPAFSVGAGLVVGLPILAFLISGMPLSWELPALKGFNFKGGLVIKPEFMALLTALALYTGAFIAENVRSGIQAVSHGQTEAAYALGIKPNWTMRLIIIPQALRVVVPPLTSQYLNLTKNSSLAVAIGYPDLVATFGGTTLNQTGQAVECILITMLVYLSISLSISLVMNWYNRRISLVER